MEVNAGYWATTHFNPNLDVRIIGLTVQEENILVNRPDDTAREIVGTWIQEEQPSPGRITIFLQDGAMYMEKTYRDGSIGKHEMVEIPSNQGQKLMKANRSRSSDDYYLIDNRGELQLWSQDLDGSHVLVVTARSTTN